MLTHSHRPQPFLPEMQVPSLAGISIPSVKQEPASEILIQEPSRFGRPTRSNALLGTMSPELAIPIDWSSASTIRRASATQDARATGKAQHPSSRRSLRLSISSSYLAQSPKMQRHGASLNSHPHPHKVLPGTRSSRSYTSISPLSPVSQSPIEPETPIGDGDGDEVVDPEDVWNLIPYNIPWGPSYEGYRSGTLPGPEGLCLFLRSPTPLKNQRTGQACEKCRERKAKCSGTRPSCQRCTTRGLTCEYGPETKVLRSSRRLSSAAYDPRALSPLDQFRRNSSATVASSSLSPRSSHAADTPLGGGGGGGYFSPALSSCSTLPPSSRSNSISSASASASGSGSGPAQGQGQGQGQGLAYGYHGVGVGVGACERYTVVTDDSGRLLASVGSGTGMRDDGLGLGLGLGMGGFGHSYYSLGVYGHQSKLLHVQQLSPQYQQQQHNLHLHQQHQHQHQPEHEHAHAHSDPPVTDLPLSLTKWPLSYPGQDLADTTTTTTSTTPLTTPSTATSTSSSSSSALAIPMLKFEQMDDYRSLDQYRFPSSDGVGVGEDGQSQSLAMSMDGQERGELGLSSVVQHYDHDYDAQRSASALALDPQLAGHAHERVEKLGLGLGYPSSSPSSSSSEASLAASPASATSSSATPSGLAVGIADTANSNSNSNSQNSQNSQNSRNASLGLSYVPVPVHGSVLNSGTGTGSQECVYGSGLEQAYVPSVAFGSGSSYVASLGVSGDVGSIQHVHAHSNVYDAPSHEHEHEHEHAHSHSHSTYDHVNAFGEPYVSSHTHTHPMQVQVQLAPMVHQDGAYDMDMQGIHESYQGWGDSGGVGGGTGHANVHTDANGYVFSGEFGDHDTGSMYRTR